MKTIKTPDQLNSAIYNVLVRNNLENDITKVQHWFTENYSPLEKLIVWVQKGSKWFEVVHTGVFEFSGSYYDPSYYLTALEQFEWNLKGEFNAINWAPEGGLKVGE